MKIILSRKGFDSRYGKQASPILPNGTLLSLPIPLDNDLQTFTDLSYNGKSYYDIIRELKPTTIYDQSQTCHLDPDLREEILLNRDQNWKAVFGQSDGAQTHLANQGVTIGDVFLFFGWYKETEELMGKQRLRYKRKALDLHVIYGYFQIGEIYNNGADLPDYVKYHSHANEEHQSKKTNCIYVASKNLSLNENLKGAGVLNYAPRRVLTKNGMTRTKWELPDFFRQLTISHHNQNSFKEDHFKSVDIGQEFVIEANEELVEWTKQIIED